MKTSLRDLIAFLLVMFILIFMLTRCATLEEIGELIPKDVPTVKSLFPKQEWTDYAHKLVRDKGLASLKLSDAKEYCPKGLSEANWVHLLASVAKRESGMDPKQEYKESFKDSSGRNVISTGLFQISLESARQSAYGCRDFIKTQSDLHDAYKNIHCSVNIMEHWARKDGVVSRKVSGKWIGALARYWSVGRDSLPKTKGVLSPLCE